MLFLARFQYDKVVLRQNHVTDWFCDVLEIVTETSQVRHGPKILYSSGFLAYM